MSVAKSKSFRGIVNKETRVLKIVNKERLHEFLATLKGEVDITISEIHSRSFHQNNYYWKVVIGTMLTTESFGGYTKMELHDTLKEHFKVASTSTLDSAEFTDYIDRVTRWCAIEFGIHIPDPDGDWELEEKE